MSPAWEPDLRLVEEVVGPSHRKYTVRKDGPAAGLAEEAWTFLNAFPAPDPAIDYVRRELLLCTEALRLGITAAHVKDNLAAVVLGRVLVESAIRLSWIMGEGSADADAVSRRLKRLEKLDVRALLDASTVAAQHGLGHLVDDPEQLRAALDANPEEAAPYPLKKMAREAGWEWLYGLHRYCSALIHPGLYSTSGVVNAAPLADLMLLLQWPFSAVVTTSAGIAKALAPTVDQPEPRMNMHYFVNKGLAGLAGDSSPADTDSVG